MWTVDCSLSQTEILGGHDDANRFRRGSAGGVARDVLGQPIGGLGGAVCNLHPRACAAYPPAGRRGRTGTEPDPGVTGQEADPRPTVATLGATAFRSDLPPRSCSSLRVGPNQPGSRSHPTHSIRAPSQPAGIWVQVHEEVAYPRPITRECPGETGNARRGRPVLRDEPAQNGIASHSKSEGSS